MWVFVYLLVNEKTTLRCEVLETYKKYSAFPLGKESDQLIVYRDKHGRSFGNRKSWYAIELSWRSKMEVTYDVELWLHLSLPKATRPNAWQQLGTKQ